MSTVENPARVMPLVEGQRLDRATFHERYEAMPPGTRVELINGVVYMPSPMGRDHSKAELSAGVWLNYYADHTPGVEALANASTLLGPLSEPQPDALLYILPEFGGRVRPDPQYVRGIPELVVEVARATRYVDLGPKLDEYERQGVLEYLVRAFDPDEILWHVWSAGRYVLVEPDDDGLVRSRTFPGLWLDPLALLADNTIRLRAVIDQGRTTREHAVFVAGLAATRATH
jgi:Uma2 family endonuclease